MADQAPDREGPVATGRVDDRISVHEVTFAGATLDELRSHWSDLGTRRVSLLDSRLRDGRLASVVREDGLRVESVFHLFGGADELCRVLDAAAAAQARVVYLLTGGRRGASWDRAADSFCAAVAPCVEQARQAGVALAIENACGLYADLHLAHTLRDTIELAERAGLGVCIDLFHCWTEAHCEELIVRALPRTELIQLSDHVLGDRSLPARAVPGDGDIPLRSLVATALAGGYPHGFDLELLGPRIDAEGHLAAARRGCAAATALLGPR